jgi:hypothetical protein
MRGYGAFMSEKTPVDVGVFPDADTLQKFAKPVLDHNLGYLLDSFQVLIAEYR